MKKKDFEQEELLTPSQVASIFGVDPKTVTRWAVAGKLPYSTTMGGHRRYKEEDVYALRNRHSVEGGE